MKQSTIISFIGLAAFALSGCTGGTTYGTGVSHEEKTVKGLYNLLSLKPEEKKNIDYSSRPNLVMPSDQAQLPVPGEAQQTDQNWPVSPEQRIAIARGEAP